MKTFQIITTVIAASLAGLLLLLGAVADFLSWILERISHACALAAAWLME